MTSDGTLPVFKFDKIIETSIPAGLEWFSNQLPPSQGYVIYTDGSIINEEPEQVSTVST